MGAERTFPREDKERRRTPSLRSVPRYVSPIGARYPVQSGQAGAGRSPISPVYGWVLSPVSEGGKKLRILIYTEHGGLSAPATARATAGAA